MRRILIILGLQLFATVLACFRFLFGVTPEEAINLLNIPHLHPPGMRTLFHALEPFLFQELLLRFLVATIVIQAVHIVWSIGKQLSLHSRITLCTFWLLSSAVLLQAGTLAIAPLSAVQGLILLWLSFHPQITSRLRGVWSLFWLWSLFSAYHALVYIPLMLFAFRRAKLTWVHTLLLTCAPVLLLVLFVFTQPMLSTLPLYGGDSLFEITTQDTIRMVYFWAIGGGLFGSVLASWWIIHTPQWHLISTLILAGVYTALFSSFFPLAILFTPVFVGGLYLYLNQSKQWVPPLSLLALLSIVSITVVSLWLPVPQPSAARTTMQALHRMNVSEPILIHGSFGHEWQYESLYELRRFTSSLLPQVNAVVCIESCPALDSWDDWRRVPFLSVEVWVREDAYNL